MSAGTGRRDREVMILARGLQDAIGTLERVCDRLARLERILEGGYVTPPPTRRLRRAPPLICAVSVTVRSFPDGFAEAVIDGSEPVRLAPLLAALFAILRAESGETGDGLVGWKSTAEIRLRIFEKRGRNMGSDHALHQAVYRLRAALASKGINPGLLQFNADQGYRLAVLAQGLSRASPELSSSR